MPKLAPSRYTHAYTATLWLAIFLLLSTAVPALAHSENDAANENYDNAGAIRVLYNRCVIISGAPHWIDTGWISAPSAHRQGMKRLCDLAYSLLTDGQGGWSPTDRSREGRIVALPPESRPFAFASVCRDEARSGAHSLHALDWRNSPHKKTKVRICDLFERALTASYFRAHLE